MKTSINAKFLVILPLLVAAGCGEGQKAKVELKGKDDAILITMSGKPAMTKVMLDEEFKKLLDENPQYKAILEMMPDAKLNFLKGWAQQLAIDEWVKETGTDKKKEYQDELDHMMVSLRRMLNTKYFGLSLAAEAAEEDMMKFYEENKDKAPDWVVSRGGVKTVAVKIDKEADAKAFLAKAKLGFDKAVKEAKLAIAIDTIVNANSNIEPALRAAVLKITKYPTIDIVKAGNTFYIFNVASKSGETVYKPFAEVKEQVKQIIENKKRQEQFAAQVDELIKKFNIEINADNLAPKAEAPKAEELPAVENKTEAPVAAPEAAPVAPAAKEAPAAA